MMKQVATLLTCSVITLASPISWACSYDGLFSNPFSESYPGALDVSIATQKALRAQSIQLPEQLDGAQGLRRASWWLNLMVDIYPELPSGTYVYLVDRQLWSQRSEQSMVVHVTPPPQGVSVVQLSEAALHNLISNQISLEQARELGLLTES